MGEVFGKQKMMKTLQQWFDGEGELNMLSKWRNNQGLLVCFDGFGWKISVEQNARWESRSIFLYVAAVVRVRWQKEYFIYGLLAWLNHILNLVNLQMNHFCILLIVCTSEKEVCLWSSGLGTGCTDYAKCCFGCTCEKLYWFYLCEASCQFSSFLHFGPNDSIMVIWWWF